MVLISYPRHYLKNINTYFGTVSPSKLPLMEVQLRLIRLQMIVPLLHISYHQIMPSLVVGEGDFREPE